MQSNTKQKSYCNSEGKSRGNVRYLRTEEKREKAEAEEMERMKRKVDLEGRRLLVVRAAETAGF